MVDPKRDLILLLLWDLERVLKPFWQGVHQTPLYGYRFFTVPFNEFNIAAVIEWGASPVRRFRVAADE